MALHSKLHWIGPSRRPRRARNRYPPHYSRRFRGVRPYLTGQRPFCRHPLRRWLRSPHSIYHRGPLRRLITVTNRGLHPSTSPTTSSLNDGRDNRAPTFQQGDDVTRTYLKCIMDIQSGHISPTRLRNMLRSMAEEFLIDSLQDGAVEVSNGTVHQPAGHLI